MEPDGTFARAPSRLHLPNPSIPCSRFVRAAADANPTNRYALAYVHYELEPGRRTAANLLMKDEAQRIAANIAELPELVRRPEY